MASLPIGVVGSKLAVPSVAGATMLGQFDELSNHRARSEWNLPSCQAGECTLNNRRKEQGPNPRNCARSRSAFAARISGIAVAPTPSRHQVQKLNLDATKASAVQESHILLSVVLLAAQNSQHDWK